ncbi:MAG: DUF503 domain-containing protein [candidate division WOR-3 bacterium]
MFIGMLLIDCLLGNGHSLKEKRRYLMRLSQRIKNNFNVAIGEVGGENLWQRSSLLILTMNTSQNILRKNLERIIQMMEREPYFQLLSYEIKDLSINHFLNR